MSGVRVNTGVEDIVRPTINTRLVDLENTLSELTMMVNVICDNVFGAMMPDTQHMPTKGDIVDARRQSLATRIEQNTLVCKHNICKLIEITEELM